MGFLLRLTAAAAMASAAALSGTADQGGNRLDQRGCDSVFAKPDALGALGTLEAKKMPHYLTNNPLPNGKPWANMNCANTNPYNTRPDTGVTRTYNFTVSKQQASPDGVENTLLLVNGQFPGPTIEANWGDWIEVSVTNAMEGDGTTIHWHGLLQQETPWMDGVPGIQQCPIASGETFTYRFRADLYGTGWYHSHVEAQFASGLYGPMVIYGPSHVDYDVDLGPVVVADYYHGYYQNILAGFLAKDLRVTKSDNNLINGRNPYQGNCAPRSSFSFTSGQRIRMRFVNPSAFAVQKISIDGHRLTVMANDYVPVQPYDTDVITLAPGQRTDAIVEATGKPTDAVWLRAFKPPSCSPCQPGSNEALAAIFYEKADRNKAPTTKAGQDAYNTYCGNDALSRTKPVLPIAPGDPALTEIVPITVRSNGSSYLWYMANRTFEADYNDPVLLDVHQGHLGLPLERNVHNYGNAKSVRMVLENPGDQPHPLHLHGHNFFVLQEGPCKADAAADHGFRQHDQSDVVSSKAGMAAASNTANPPARRATSASKRGSAGFSALGKRQFWGWGGGGLWGPNSQQGGKPPQGNNPPQGVWGGSPWQGQEFGGGQWGSAPSSAGHQSSDHQGRGHQDGGHDNGGHHHESDNHGHHDGSKDGKSGGHGSASSTDKAEKYGSCWDGSIVNKSNPQRRDTQMLLPGHYVVLQWFLDNPGVWPLHCHIAWHASAGFAWMVLEQPDAIQKDSPIPYTMSQTCPDWDKWSSKNTVPQIGDGIKML